MMKCIKTGLTLYVTATDQHTRVDLFFDGRDLYVNKNTYFDGKPSTAIEASCTYLEVGEQYDKMMYPAVEESVIEYVDTMRHKTRAEEFFVEMFKK